MDSLGQAVTFPMLLQDDGTASDSVIVNEMGAGGQQSFVFAPNLSDGTTTLLSFALFHDNQSLQQNGNTTNIIIKQNSQNNLAANTIFLDPAQVALLSSGAGQVVLTGADGFLEDGQQNSEAQQIFLQVAGDSLVEDPKTATLEGQEEGGTALQTMHAGPAAERKLVQPLRRRGPGRPRRDDSKIMPPSVKGVWYCQVCGKEFTKWPLLKKHLKAHSDDKPHRCMSCPASFNVAWNLKLHEATHIRQNTSPLKCPACTRTFSRIASLKAHIMLHEEDESLFCTHCGEEFSTQCQLDDHMQAHEADGPINSLSINSPILQNAVWISEHSIEAQFPLNTAEQQIGGQSQQMVPGVQRCRLCNALFRKGSQLREHMKEHSKVKASLSRRNHKRNIDRSSFIHKCKECHKGFQKPSQLVRHMRIHTGEKPYQCPNCEKAFNQKGSLQIHMTKHTGVKPFTCEFCSAGFRQRGNLRAHILRVHTIPVSGELTFRCCECPCVFRKLGSLNAHVSRVHGNTTVAIKKRKRDDDGNEEDEDVEDEVSVVMRQLAALEEATRGLGEAASKEDSPAKGSEGSKAEVAAVSVEKIRREVSADILQQALEKSGLSGAKKKVIASLEDAKAKQKTTVEKGDVEDKEENAEGSKEAENSPSQSCMLTLADKGHDGTVRRLNIKVRKAGGFRWHQCTYCTKEFKKPSDLVRHIRIHTHEKPYKCYLCFRAFAVKSTLTVHLRIHSGLKSYECQTCKKKFASQSSLKVHQRLHSGLKPFPCPHCNLRFRTTGHRKTHVSSHFRARSKLKKNKKPPEEDSSIKRVFLQEPIVVQQSLEPTEEPADGTLPGDQSGVGKGTIMQQLHENRPHKCTQCHGAFKKLSHLKQHMRSHTGEKPFGCVSCNRAFVSKGVLRAHLKTHVPIMSPFRKPHECSECGRKFVAAGSLKRHILNAHENLRKTILKQTFLCPYCPAPPFNSNKACRKHITTHTEELLAAQEQQGQEQTQEETTIYIKKSDNLPVIQEEDVGEEMEADTMTQVAIETEDRSEVVGDSTVSDNVVVTFSLDFQAADGFDQQVSNPCTIEERVEPANTQAVATISLADTEPLTQESLRQIEQTLGTGMFADADTMVANANEANAEASSHVKDSALDFETHTISFDPSVFSNITLPAADTLNLHQTLQTIEPMQATEPVAEIVEKEEGGKVRKKKIHKCSYCERVFKKFSHLKPHLRIHTGEKPFQCPVCLRMFVTMGTLKAHLRTHTGEKSFSCNSCGAHFTTNGSLTRHQALHNDDNRPYQCERCPLTFCTKGQWRRHWRSHESELIGSAIRAESHEGEASTRDISQQPQPQEENAMNKKAGARRRTTIGMQQAAAGVIRLSEEETTRLAMQSPSQPHLTLSERVLIASAAERGRVSEINDRERQLRAAPKLPHLCSHCPKSFRKPSDLARHIRTHTGERPFECDKCGRRFTVKSTLDSHRLTHPPDADRGVLYHPKYPCHVCGCLFATKGSLKVHMRLHTGARPFKCPYCELRFRTSGHRKAHLLTHLRPQQSMMDSLSGGEGKSRSRAGRGRRAKAVAMEAIRSMDATIQDSSEDTNQVEDPSSDVVEDWGTLQANLGGGGGGFQLQLEGGSLSLQLDEGLLRQIQQQGLVHDEEGKEAAQEASAIDAHGEKVAEPLVFEAGDVNSLFGPPLEVILDETKRLRREEKALWAGGRQTDNLIIDGDFVLEEDGTLRQVVGGSYVVVSALHDEEKQ